MNNFPRGTAKRTKANDYKNSPQNKYDFEQK
jgi:hypothetical protein